MHQSTLGMCSIPALAHGLETDWDIRAFQGAKLEVRTVTRLHP